MILNRKTPPPRAIENCVKPLRNPVPLLDGGIQSIRKMDPLVKPEEDKAVPKASRVAAFTLVEMSIVLIIIGLIVAGIAKGQDMIRAGKIMSVVSDVQKIKMAIRLFEDKYDYLPGDLPNAEDYWPGATYNGNGSRYLHNSSGGVPNEKLSSWVHLNLSGFLPNSMTGSGGPYRPGINMYQSSIDKAGFELEGGNGMGGGNDLFNHVPANFIRFGATQGSSLMAPVITPAEAKQIDKKLDNGISSSGNVMGVRGSQTTYSYLGKCSNSSQYYAFNNAPGEDDYLVSNENKSCYMVFWLD